MKTHKKITLLTTCLLGMLLFTQCKKEETAPSTPVSTDPDVNRMTTTVGLAYNTSTQTDPVCFIDFDSAHVFAVSEANAHANEIDAVYVLRYTNANDPMFISIGNFDGQSGYPISSWNKTTLGINTFSYYNHTAMHSAISTLTTTAFQGITKLSQLKSYVGTGPAAGFDNQAIDQTQIGNIFAFRTQQNKVGAFRLLDAQNGSGGYATIEIVIEK